MQKKSVESAAEARIAEFIVPFRTGEDLKTEMSMQLETPLVV